MHRDWNITSHKFAGSCVRRLFEIHFSDLITLSINDGSCFVFTKSHRDLLLLINQENPKLNTNSPITSSLKKLLHYTASGSILLVIQISISKVSNRHNNAASFSSLTVDRIILPKYKNQKAEAKAEADQIHLL